MLDARFAGTTDAFTLVNARLRREVAGATSLVTSLKVTNLGNQEVQQHIFGDILQAAGGRRSPIRVLVIRGRGRPASPDRVLASPGVRLAGTVCFKYLPQVCRLRLGILVTDNELAFLRDDPEMADLFMAEALDHLGYDRGRAARARRASRRHHAAQRHLPPVPHDQGQRRRARRDLGPGSGAQRREPARPRALRPPHDGPGRRGRRASCRRRARRR